MSIVWYIQQTPYGNLLMITLQVIRGLKDKFILDAIHLKSENLQIKLLAVKKLVYGCRRMDVLY